MTLASRKWWWLVVGVGLAASVAHGVAAGRGLRLTMTALLVGTVPVVCGWLGCLALARRPREERAAGTFTASDWGLALTLTVLSLLVLTYRIEEMPPGFFTDELFTARNTIDLDVRAPAEDGGTDRRWRSPFGSMPLFGEGWVETSNLYLYFVRAIWLVLGTGYFSMKMVSILPGALTAGILYLVGRRYFGRTAALYATLLLVFSRWHITLSRWGWDEVLATLLGLALFGVTLAAEQKKDRRLFAVAGLLAGLALYGYASARVFCLIPPLYLLLRHVITRRRVNRTAHGLAAGAAIYLGTLFLVFLPHGLAFLSAGKLRALWVRGADVSLLKSIQSSGSLESLWDNILAYAGMLFIQGPADGRMNLQQLPMLSIPAAVCFLAGLGLTLTTPFRNKHGGAGLLILLWISAAWLLGIFTRDPYSPNVYRIGFVIPVVYLVMGLGLKEVFDRLRARTAITWVRHLPWLVIVVVAAHDLVLYFVVAPGQRDIHLAFSGPQVAIARALEPRLRAGRQRVVLDDRFTDRIYSLYRVANNLVNHDVLAVERGDGLSLPTFDLLHDRPEQVTGSRRSDAGPTSICLVVLPGQEELVEQVFHVRGVERLERPQHGRVASLFTIRANDLRARRRDPARGSGSANVVRGAIHVPRDVVGRLVVEAEADWEVELDGGLVFTPDGRSRFPIARGLHAVSIRIDASPAVAWRDRAVLVVEDERGPVHRTRLEDIYPSDRLTGGLTLRWSEGPRERKRRIISWNEIPGTALRGGFTLEGEIVLLWTWPTSIRIHDVGRSAFFVKDRPVSIRSSDGGGSTVETALIPPGRTRVKLIALPCAERTGIELEWNYLSPGRMYPIRFDCFRIHAPPD